MYKCNKYFSAVIFQLIMFIFILHIKCNNMYVSYEFVLYQLNFLHQKCAVLLIDLQLFHWSINPILLFYTHQLCSP